MDPIVILVILGAIVLVLVIAGLALQRQRSDALRRRFGPVYDETVTAVGDRREAEKELAAREKRVAALDIRPLPAEERQQFAQAWQDVQTRFVDEPRKAVVDADQLVTAVMRARGYPLGNFEQRTADLSVEHSNVIAHYPAAREIARSNEAGQASTEMLRQGMIHYRALFDDLLAVPTESERKELAR
jgi:hypothetical protein